MEQSDCNKNNKEEIPVNGPNGYWGYRNLTPQQVEVTHYESNKTLTQLQILNKVKEELKDELTELWTDYRLVRFIKARYIDNNNTDNWDNEVNNEDNKNHSVFYWDSIISDNIFLSTLIFHSRGFDVEKSLAMIREDMRWRRDEKIDEIVETFPKSRNGQQLLSYWPAGFCGVDHRGVPVWYERIALVDAKGVCKIPEPDLLKLHIYFMEYQGREMLRVCKELGYPIDGSVYVQDCTGLGMRHAHPPAISIIQKTIKIDEAHYPEVLKKMFVTNTPTLFSMFYKMLKPFVDPVTLSEIEILGTGADYVSVLAKEVKEEFIPSYLGGKNQNHGIKEGGPFGADSGDIELIVHAKSKQEVKIEVTKEQRVLSYEIKTEKYDINFGIYFERDGQRKELHPPTKIEAPLEGHVEAEEEGTLVLLFDNTHSLLRKKVIKYQYELLQVQPEQTEQE